MDDNIGKGNVCFHRWEQLISVKIEVQNMYVSLIPIAAIRGRHKPQS